MWLRASGTWARYLKTDAVPCSREPLSCFSAPMDKADATGWDETRPVASDPGGSSSETSPPSSSLMPSVALAGYCMLLRASAYRVDEAEAADERKGTPGPRPIPEL